MAGLGDRAFRELCRSYGAGPLAICPMLSASALQHKETRQKTLSLCDWSGEAHPRAAQLFGSVASELTEAARVLQDNGIELVDLNLGCQMPKIVKMGAGAALLRQPARALELVAALRATLTCPLTVKMRLGWAQSDTAEQMVSSLASLGVSAVAVHARTAVDGFAAPPNWPALARVCARSPLPIIANGSIATAAQAAAVWQVTQCSGIMLGRQALRTPWIFAELAGVDLPGAGLAGAGLPGAELAGAEVPGAGLPGAGLADATLVRPPAQGHAHNLTADKLAATSLPSGLLADCLRRHVGLCRQYELEENTGLDASSRARVLVPNEHEAYEERVVHRLRRHFTFYRESAWGQALNEALWHRLMQANTFDELAQILS